MSPPTPAADLRDFLISAGAAMNAAGDPVSDVQQRLAAISSAYGVDDPRIAVTPTSILVAIPGAKGADLALRSEVNETLRLDQTAAVFAVANAAQRAEVDLGWALGELGRIEQAPPRFPVVVRVLGHAVLTTGLLLLQLSSGRDLVAGAILGLGVGLFRLWRPRDPSLAAILPVLAAVLVSAPAFLAADHGLVDSPLRLVIAALITFLPGAALTTGTIDVSAGQMLSGTARLVQGLIQLLLLAFGIVAAAELVGVDTASAFAETPVAVLRPFAAWIGVVAFALGLHLHLCGARRTVAWTILVLATAYAGQVGGTALLGSSLSGFVGALVMTPVAVFVSEQRHGPPLMATFMPAFWLLVPGAVGLLGVTKLFGGQSSADVLVTTVSTVIGIALGVLVGLSTQRPIQRLVHRR